MKNSVFLRVASFTLLAGVLLAGCSSPRIATVDENTRYYHSSVSVDSVISSMPASPNILSSVDGKGKAIVSEPGNTERVTVYFKGNRQKSLVTIKNALGIEGGQMLSDDDSLLVYNKVDNVARKISVQDGRMNSVQHLASVNIVKMLNFEVEAGRVQDLYESNEKFMLVMDTGAEVVIGKEDFTVARVDQPQSSGLPYSRIIYEAYGNIGGFTLPRRVTIFSSDARSKVALLIQSLEVNPGELELEINLPNDVKLVSR